MALIDDTAPVAPLEALLNSIYTALTAKVDAAKLEVLRKSVAEVASVAERNTLHPDPVQGARVYRSDLGYEEVYYDLYHVTTNPGGASSAGWKTKRTPFAQMEGATPSNSIPAGGAISYAVTFPAGKFTVPPIVKVGLVNGVRDLNAYAEAITTTGFNLVRGSQRAVAASAIGHWSATQMTPTSAAG